MSNNMGIGMTRGGSALTGYAAHPQQHLQNNVNMANNAYALNQQAFAAQAHNQLLAAAHAQRQKFQPKPYRFNGVDMDADEFANAIFPEDCPEKTYLILKMKGNENE